MICMPLNMTITPFDISRVTKQSKNGSNQNGHNNNDFSKNLEHNCFSFFVFFVLLLLF